MNTVDFQKPEKAGSGLLVLSECLSYLLDLLAVFDLTAQRMIDRLRICGIA